MINTTRLYYRKKDFNQPFSIAPVRHLRCPEPTFEQNLRAKKRLRARARIALNGEPYQGVKNYKFLQIAVNLKAESKAELIVSIKTLITATWLSTYLLIYDL